ncbi:MAG TPA: tyrosine-type recombinase/integrase [Acidobacteriota bacterium]|nr:tyrosine-type recombinase/integrase [Acidobacteriota bacterium]
MKKPEGYVFQDGDSWVARVTFTDEHGQRRNLKRRCVNKTEAKDALISLRIKIHNGEASAMMDANKTTLAQLIEKWWQLCVDGQKAPRTAADYQTWMQRYVLPDLGSKKLSVIGTVHIQALYKGMTARGLSSRTIQYTHAILSQVFKQAVRWNLLTKNPCEGIRLPQRKRVREIKVLSVQECQQFIQTCFAHPDEGLVFAFLLETGTRPQEATGLDWSHINLDTGTVRIDQAVVWVNGKWSLNETKTHKSKRELPLSGQLLELLRQHRQRQLEHRLKIGALFQNHNFVFCRENGLPLRVDTLRYPLARILEQAGIQTKITIYSLRHTSATLGLAVGQDLKTISQKLGHSGIQLTADSYLHPSELMQRELAEKMAGILYK